MYCPGEHAMATVQTVKVEANVGWKVFQSPTSKRWIAVCDELNLCLEGESEMELRSLIPEALHLLMTDLLGDSELDRFLHERGWRALNLPARPVGEVKFDVPW
jgi:hypothetical protein